MKKKKVSSKSKKLSLKDLKKTMGGVHGDCISIEQQHKGVTFEIEAKRVR